MKRIILLGLLLAGNIGLRAAGTEGLRCEYLDNPLGIDVTSPRLSWKVVSGKRGDCQTAYRILVASSAELLKKDRGDLWDSGRVPSDRSIQVEYAGKPLESRMRCYWKVQVWDAAGKAGPWSEPAMWSMGLLTERDWGGARWIAYRDDAQWREQWQAHKDRENSHREPTWPWFVGTGRTIWELYDMASPHYDPSPLFRKEFALGKKVKAATLYVTGVGYYEAFLNGKKIGDHVLDPAWTNFHKRTFYVTYDVTADVRRGDNALGIMVGRGQYNPLCNDIWRLGSSLWVGQPKAIALLSVEYADGTTADIVTDGSWTTAGGPILYDDTRHGELYNAREEKAGWNRPGFVADGWRPAAVVDGSGPLYAQMMPPVRCFAPIAPVKTFDKGNGRTAYDIGRNIAGWARVRVSGPAGARVLVEYCELPSDPELVPDIHPSKMKFKIGDPDYASFYDKSINIRQQNGYILKGGGPETFECRFSYKGFQYIRVTADEGVTVERVEGVPVHTDVADAGSFVCSNETVNRLQQMSRATLLNNIHSIPTDCPHREKQGWTADTYMTDQTAIYNFDMAAFYAKWATDLAGTADRNGGLCTVAPSTGYDQSISTVWPAAIVFVPWDLLCYYGDRRVVERHYETMKRFAESSLLRQADGKPEIIREVLGDWVSPHMTLSDTLQSYEMAPPEGLTLYGTASHYRVVKYLAGIARYLDRPQEAERMDAWAARIAESFNREFFDPATKTYHGDKPTPYRQAANVVPLEYGIVPQSDRDAVQRNLISDLQKYDGRIGTGFVGTMALMDLLPQVDPELAYRLATQPAYPGWGFMVANGANTMWETWDGSASRNHPPFCLISGYFYKYLAGIRCVSEYPGFKRFVIDPSVVGDLTFVEAWHDSMYGRIESGWKRDGERLTLDVTVPVNTSAVVHVPAASAEGITESGRPAAEAPGVRFLRMENGKALYEVVSGTYRFQSSI